MDPEGLGPDGLNMILMKWDLKWQVAMISIRMKTFYKKTGRKLQFDAKNLLAFDKPKWNVQLPQLGIFARRRIKGNKKCRVDTIIQKMRLCFDGLQQLDQTQSIEPSELVSEPVVNESNIECQPKVWSDAPIIEEYESDSEDEYVSTPRKEQETPSFANQQVKTPRETIKNQFTHSQKPKVDKTELGRTVGGKKDNLFKPSAGCNWETTQRIQLAQCLPNTNGGSNLRNVTLASPLGKLSPNRLGFPKEKLISFSFECHDWKQPTFVEYQDFNGGPVCFWRTFSNFILFLVSQICDKKKPGSALMTMNEDWLFNWQGDNRMNLIKWLGGWFAGKSDEGFLVGYSLHSKVYNLETKRVEENLHITFLENKPNVAGKGPTWLFDLDYLTDSMNYHPVRSENQANLHAGQQEANQNAGTEDTIDALDSEKEDESAQDCFVLPIWPSYSSTITPALKTDDKREGPREEEQVFMDELERLKRQEKEANEEAEALRKKFEQETENLVIQEGAAKTSSTNIFSTVSTPAKASSTNLVNTVSIPVSTASPHEGLSLSDPTNPEEDDSEIPPLEDIYQNSTDGIFTTSSYDDEGAVADFTNLETVVNVSPIPTSRIHSSHPSALILGDPTSAVQTRSKVNTSSGAHAFVSYYSEALEDESWVDDVQERMLQFEIQNSLDTSEIGPFGKKALGTKKGWGLSIYKKDERGVVVRNKAKSTKVGKALRAYITAHRAGYASVNLLLIAEWIQKTEPLTTLFIKKDNTCIILVQVMWLNIILWALQRNREVMSFEAINESTMIEIRMPLVKDEEASDVDVHLYRSLQSPPQLSVVREFLDSDYARANLDRKSTTGEAEYVAAASCYGQVLWIQNQMLDYRFQFLVVTLGDDNSRSCTLRFDRIREFIEYAFDGMKQPHTPCSSLWLGQSYVLTVQSFVTAGKILYRYRDVEEKYRQGYKFLTQSLSNTIRIYKPNFSLNDVSSVRTTMAVLDSCPKHNMVAYLEKSEGNAEFHEIIDFLKRSSIHHALTAHITAKAIFDAIQLMGYEGDLTVLTFNKALFSPQWRSIILQINLCWYAEHLDAKKKVGKVTPLFASMLVQPTEDEGAPSERPSEAQPTPSPAHTSEAPFEPHTDSSPAHTSEVPIEQQNDPSPRPSPSTIIPDSIPETSGGNLGGHSSSKIFFPLSGKEACPDPKSQKAAKPVINLTEHGCKSISLKPRLAKKEIPQQKTIENRSGCREEREIMAESKALLELIRGKTKGNKKIEEEDESESESDGIPEAEKKFKQLENDEEMARKIQEEWEELRAGRLLAGEASKNKKERNLQ
ncbi:hypothetical protein Tco_0955955 [Tanacetum coccineum]|uniref:Uncharacterized protein n=1 Tax=Tanacetum coccineum TaxID=301880 RepID=A0ABQ5E8P5_9ASTR